MAQRVVDPTSVQRVSAQFTAGRSHANRRGWPSNLKDLKGPDRLPPGTELSDFLIIEPNPIAAAEKAFAPLSPLWADPDGI